MNFMTNTFKSAQEAFENFDKFLEVVIGPESFEINLTVDVDNYNSDPEFTVKLNDTIIYNDTLEQGEQSIGIKTVLDKPMNQLTFTMTGKNSGDTLVENGQIVRDKYIKLIDFKINNFDILKDVVLFHQKFWYTVDQQADTVKPGFWNNNATLGLDFAKPFTVWYQQQSTSNTALADSLKYQNTTNHKEITAQVIENIKKLKH